MGVIVCYAKCWECNLGECPGGAHTWMDADDIDCDPAVVYPTSPEGWAALAVDRPCGCPCVRREVSS